VESRRGKRNSSAIPGSALVQRRLRFASAIEPKFFLGRWRPAFMSTARSRAASRFPNRRLVSGLRQVSTGRSVWRGCEMLE
jgi:hypothetical protein